MALDYNELRIDAIKFAKAGGDSTLKYFNKSFALEFKDDESPVTNADREAESLIREMIQKKYPSHGIIGEEFGSENKDADVVWILDPIDGTKSFIHGVPLYTTLIGVLVQNSPVVGVIYAPALNEMAAAGKGLGCTLNGKSCRVRECSDISKATFLTTNVNSFSDHGFEQPFRELVESARIHRTWGDAYGHMLVATGRADIMIDPILNIWDAAALFPIVTEAGGSYTDVFGNGSIETGNAISTNPVLSHEILSIFENYR
ncbi:histidinol-phosphatase [Rhodohalobacter mucosus]|uniref:Histidinol-phosphatase n=1 Tax=Rhodohalobacter mucosus TaxID=2079485 RepID=A0A316TXZ9_9BACT|nr:histidinol-phosphatase [Rhodohalobacter mucosus]PWN07622.1 histidinol-phosphatase [Rhodohalobacter mucosus]